MSEQAALQAKSRGIQASLMPVSYGILHRCSNGVECEECRKKREGTLQRAAVNTPSTSSVPPIVHEVLRSPGQPLDAGTQAFMGSRFDHDFSDVRIHDDTHAAESVRSVNALAYTVGRDVVFGAGQYAPGSLAGKRLLAHELTHVVQQRTRPAASLSTFSISSRSDASEREADGVADSIMRHQQASVPMIQRKIPPSNANLLQRQSNPGSSDIQPELSPTTKTSSAQSLTIDAFVINHAELTQDQKHHLDRFIATVLPMLSNQPNASIKIIGHADAPGKEDYNMALGQKRADSVASYLISKKIPATNIRTASKGETQLLIKTQRAEPRNRRVEMILESETRPKTEKVGPSDAESKHGMPRKKADQHVQLTLSPPPNQQLTAEQAKNIAKQQQLQKPAEPQRGETGKHEQPSQPAQKQQVFQPLKREPVQPGVDVSLDSSVNFQLSFVARHLDAKRFSLFGQVPIDLLHEPTLTLSASFSPLTFGTLGAQISATLLNIHFQQHGTDFIELGLGQLGIGFDSDGNVIGSAGAQAEIHSSNPHFSIFINTGGTLKHTKDNKWETDWTPISFGILVHWANP